MRLSRASRSELVRRATVLVPVVVLVTIAVFSMSCTNRSRAANAGLRDRIHVLEEQNRKLDLRNTELEIQLTAAGETSSAPMSAGHPAIPVVTKITIDGASGRRQLHNESGQRPLEIHVRAVDGHDRPVQLAGSMRIQVTRIVEGRPPVELYAVDLSPEEVRDAWRGGVLGVPTWMVSVPLRDEDFPPGVRMVDVDIFYDDLRTGEQLVCGDKVDIR